MPDEEEILGAGTTEPLPEGEAALPAEEEAPVEGVVNLTVEDIPSLSEKAIGDIVSLEVRSISDDGMSFELVPVLEESSAEVGGGRAEVQNAMLV